MSMCIVKEILHYCHIKPKGCSKMGERTIDFYDLTFVLEGSMTYIVNNKRYILNSNDAIFLPPKTCRLREQGNSYVNYASFNFQLSAEANLSFDIFMQKCLTSNLKRLLSLYQEAHISDSPNSRAKCECLLNYILFELSDAVAENSRNAHVAKMLEYVNIHITDKITLKNISDYMHLSKEYCSYLFKKETKNTLINYINEKKMSVAKELIIDKAMPLIDICYYLGYNNYNYFSRMFKKYTGIPPTSFLFLEGGDISQF